MWGRSFYTFIQLSASYRKLAYWSLTLPFLLPLSVAAQPIPCDGSFYLFLIPHGNATTSEMYRVEYDINTGQPTFELINPDIGRRVAAVGYSVWDQHIYALDHNTLELLRIDGSGNVAPIIIPPGLDTVNYYYTAGEVAPAGLNFYVIGKDKATGRDKTLFGIPLRSETYYAGRVSILSDSGASLEDFTYDPIVGTVYGYDYTTRKLIWLDQLNGSVADYFFPSMAGVERLGSLFFDRSGALHAYGGGGSEESTFYNINKLRGALSRITSGPDGRFSDGCGCPYHIRNLKTIEPEEVFPCSEITITYQLINHAGTPYSYVEMLDTLPPGLIITEIVKQPIFSDTGASVGSNILSIKNFDLRLDTNLIIVKAKIEEELLPGMYESQATLGAFPDGLGRIVLSDNPKTVAAVDATRFTVIDKQTFNLSHRKTLLCDGSGYRLSVNIPGASYSWNTGATTASIEANSPGLYAVTVTTPCGLYADSVYIEDFPEPLELELGEPLEVELGQEVYVEAYIAANQYVKFQWQVLDSSSLECPSCQILTERPLKDTYYALTVTDANGCQASDTLLVEVKQARRIYFPTVFSPNADGQNDIFYLQGLQESAQVKQFKIFDRWGNLLFEQQDGKLNDVTNGWDGYFNGQRMDIGIYLWVAVLEYPNGKQEQLGGEFMLLY